MDIVGFVGWFVFPPVKLVNKPPMKEPVNEYIKKTYNEHLIILSRKEQLKVSKFQKQIFLFSFEPKNEPNYLLISALASKNGSNQKIY